MGAPRVLTNQAYTRISTGHEDAWMISAACADDDPHLYDELYDKKPPPDVRCGGCAVRTPCFMFALHHEFEGVWGGTTIYQRRKIGRRQRRIKCPGAGCGSTDIQHDEGRSRATCISCGLSWYTTHKADDA